MWIKFHAAVPEKRLQLLCQIKKWKKIGLFSQSRSIRSRTSHPSSQIASPASLLLPFYVAFKCVSCDFSFDLPFLSVIFPCLWGKAFLWSLSITISRRKHVCPARYTREKRVVWLVVFVENHRRPRENKHRRRTKPRSLKTILKNSLKSVCNVMFVV